MLRCSNIPTTRLYSTLTTVGPLWSNRMIMGYEFLWIFLLVNLRLVSTLKKIYVSHMLSRLSPLSNSQNQIAGLISGRLLLGVGFPVVDLGLNTVVFMVFLFFILVPYNTAQLIRSGY